jgi:hypothetical protein
MSNNVFSSDTSQNTTCFEVLLSNLQVFVVPVFLPAAHTLHLSDGYFFLPSPPAPVHSSLCLLKSLETLQGGSFLDPLGDQQAGLWKHCDLFHFLSSILLLFHEGISKV